MKRATTYIPLFCLSVALQANGVPLVNNSSSSLPGAAGLTVSATDLVNTGQATLSSYTESVAPIFGPLTANDGTATNLTTAAGFWRSATGMPTVTFELDVNRNPLGYDITQIDSFAGWEGGGTQTYGNQKFTVEFSVVDNPGFSALTAVDYSPFDSTTSSTPAYTQSQITDDSGTLASGVDAIRIVYSEPSTSGGTNSGLVLQEIDVAGFPTGGAPPEPAITITSPTSRHIVQRGADNLGNIPITGTYPGEPDRLEARAVAAGDPGSSGTSTDWQTIDASPEGGTFSADLTRVPAGGWYTLEVRSVTDEIPAEAVTLEKIGVGDIYVTAGQSNSANHGGPAYTPTDDRVSVRVAVSGAVWRHAADPMPVASGGGGSVWSRLGDFLAAQQDVPIGFLCVGVGATEVSQWVPGTPHYDSRLRPAVQSFPANGFRAVLWHQGESDAIANVSAATHASRLQSMIGQSRTDAGWDIPWYIAEAAFHPATHLSQEEPVTAGQRLAAFTDPLTYLGPCTDDFHLEDAAGGKLIDSVHFNAAGLLDHATQWGAILDRSSPLGLENPDFEGNTDAALTTRAPLPDGGIHVVNTTTDNTSPSIINWRIISAAGTAAADGDNGYYNPDASFYPDADDTTNGGVMTNMDGKHVAFLSGGTAGNHFLQTRRTMLLPNHKHTLTVAIGIRDNADMFGGATLEILGNGQPMGGAATFTTADLDALAGGNARGKFTDASFSFSTDSDVADDLTIAVRISKTGGQGTYLDFDHVRLTASPTHFGAWQISNWGNTQIADASPLANPDQDNLANILEYAFGTPPLSGDHQAPAYSFDGTTFTMTRRIGPEAGLSYLLQRSTSLSLGSWATVTDASETIVSSDNGFETVEITRPGGLSSGDREFFRTLVSF